MNDNGYHFIIMNNDEYLIIAIPIFQRSNDRWSIWFHFLHLIQYYGIVYLRQTVK